MGAVRIYKKPYTDGDGIVYHWQVRSSGCVAHSSEDCNFGSNHSGHCDGFVTFVDVLEDLNAFYTDLGRYLTK